MVVQTEKGLGPLAIEPWEYFYLGNDQTYQRLVPGAAAYCVTLVQDLLEKWIKTYLDILIKEERKLLRTNLRLNEDPWVFLYILFKLNKVSLKTQLILPCCGNLLRTLGQIITEWLQPLARMQKSYFQDSFALKKELNRQKSHQTPACLFVMQPPCIQTSEQARHFTVSDGLPSKTRSIWLSHLRSWWTH